jgi:chemotaxis protein histidine kinase CheA
MMTTELQINRERWLAKISGQVAFLEAALSAIKQEDVGEKVLLPMHRSVVVIRQGLRNANTPELESFTCDLEDLLKLLRNGDAKLTTEIRSLLRGCTRSLMAAADALQRGESGEREVQAIRQMLFSALLVNAVTVKRRVRRRSHSFQCDCESLFVLVLSHSLILG